MSRLKIKGFEEHVNIPVTVELIGEDVVEFTLKFKRLDRDSLEKIVKDAQARALEARDLENKKIVAEDAERAQLDKKITALNKESNEVLIDKIVDWSDLFDEDGKEVPFSKRDLRLILKHPAFLRAADNALWNATGARIKN